MILKYFKLARINSKFCFLFFAALLFSAEPALYGKSVMDIRKEQEARTFGSRIRNNEPLSRDEEKYVNKILREKNITREDLADHVDKSFQRSERLKYEKAAKGEIKTTPYTSPPAESELKSFLFVLGVAVLFTTIIVFLRYLFLSIIERFKQWSYGRKLNKESEDRNEIQG